MAEGLRKLRAANARQIPVVDESSPASGEQMRNQLRVGTALRLPRVVLVDDEKQLGAVEAGKPFAQLRAARMTAVMMDGVVRQRDAVRKEAVRASLAGDVKCAFADLGDGIRRTERNGLGIETSPHCLNLPRGERERTAVIAHPWPVHLAGRTAQGVRAPRKGGGGGFWTRRAGDSAGVRPFDAIASRPGAPRPLAAVAVTVRFSHDDQQGFRGAARP